MARPSQIEFPGAIYHVMSRGNRKQASTPGSLRGPAKPVHGRRPGNLKPEPSREGAPGGLESELRVSPSPSKIPYGGFSPVRLQMDRQWRPSTTARGLSAVHIHPMIPSYTPPQFLLPGVRDPRRDFPVLEPFGSMWHDSQHRQHVHPEALGSPSGYVVPAGHRLLRPHVPLWIPPRHLWIRGGGCCTQGNRLRVGIQRFPNLLR